MESHYLFSGLIDVLEISGEAREDETGDHIHTKCVCVCGVCVCVDDAVACNYKLGTSRSMPVLCTIFCMTMYTFEVPVRVLVITSTGNPRTLRE